MERKHVAYSTDERHRKQTRENTLVDDILMTIKKTGLRHVTQKRKRKLKLKKKRFRIPLRDTGSVQESRQWLMIF